LCKHYALLCVDGLLNFAADTRIRRVIADFKRVFLALPSSSDNNARQALIKHEVGAAFWGSLARESSLALDHRNLISPTKKLWKKLNKVSPTTKSDNVAAVVATAHNLEGHDDALVDPAATMLKLAMQVISGTKRGSTDLVLTEQMEEECFQLTTIVRNYIATKYDSIHEDDSVHLPHVLLDLAQYPSSMLRETSLSLLQRINSSQQNDFAKAVQGRLLFSQRTISLARKAYSEEKVVGPDGTMVGAGVPDLKRWSQGGFYAEHDAKMFVWALGSLAADCLNAESVQGSDRLKQQVLFNAGIHAVILDIIKSPSHTKPIVLHACFNFLAALCNGFQLAQKCFFSQLDMILNIHQRKKWEDDVVAAQGFEPWQNALGRLVSNLFNNNIEASLGIRPAHIETILKLIVLWTWQSPSLLSALAMVATSQAWNIPLRRNQEVIVLNLWKNRKTVLHIAHVGIVRERGEREAKRMEQLSIPRRFDAGCRNQKDWQLEYHLNLIDLLSTSCAGKSTQIEAKCRRLLSFREVVDTLKSAAVRSVNKGPYMTYLMWVHLNAELHQDMDSSDDEEVTLEGDNDAPQFAIDDVPQMLAQAARSSTEIIGPYAKVLAGERGASDTNDKQATTGHNQRYYIFDQFIPFVTALLNSGADLFVEGQDDETVYDVGSYLAIIIRNVSDLLTITHDQSSRTGATFSKFRAYRVKDLISALCEIVRNHEENFQQEDLESIKLDLSELRNGFGREIKQQRPTAINIEVHKTTGNDVVQENKEGMAEVEIDVNTLFNAFIKVMKTCYESENTIRKQLILPAGAKTNAEDVEMLDQKSEKYADDEFGIFPLGPAFQELTHSFVKASRFRNFLSGNTTDAASGGGGLFNRKLLCVLRQLFESYNAKTNVQIQVALLTGVRGVIRAAHVLSPQCLIATQDQAASELMVALARYPLRSKVAAVRAETLEVLRSISHGGNATAQRVMSAYFMSTRDEQFFIIIDNVLATAKQNITERESLMMQKEEADEFQRRMANEMGNTKKMVSIDLTILEDDSIPNEAETLFNMWNFDDAELSLEILQLFCEGHNTVLQNYIRAQDDNYGSGKNLVSRTAALLTNATSAVINANTTFCGTAENESTGILLVVEILQFLNEAASGNFPNTEIIAHSKALDKVVELIAYTRKLKEHAIKRSIGSDTGPTIHPYVFELDVACANLLRTFLESNAEANLDIMNLCAKTVNMGDLFFLVSAYKEASDAEIDRLFDSTGKEPEAITKTKETKERCQNYQNAAFAYYSIIARLKDLTGVDYSAREDEHTSINFAVMASNAASVEIWIDGSLQRVHFYSNPTLLDELIGDAESATRNRQTRELDWTNNQGKERIEDFVFTSQEIIADHRRMMEFKVRSWMSKFLIHHNGSFKQIGSVLTWTINLLMICFWTAKEGEFPVENQHYVRQSDFGNRCIVVARGRY
jgi:hypothetical protein